MTEYALTEKDRRLLALALHGVAIRQKDRHEEIVALAKKIDAEEFLLENAESWIRFSIEMMKEG